jgi:iron complex transport system substrate-binding protein
MRLVSLCPSLTELVFDLGRGDDLVGITRWCVHPADEVARIETVGGTKDPEVARIIELAPDLVLMNDEENRVEDADDLRAAGVTVLSSLPRTCADTAGMVRGIAAALERAGIGEAIACDIESRTARVKAGAEGLDSVRFAYLIWRQPFMCAGMDTFASDLLSQAGGMNVFGDSAERYPEFTAEDLAACDPDVILLGSEPFPFEDEHALQLAEATRLPRERFVLADGEYLSWHGSRTPQGIDYAEGLIQAGRLNLS